jgi:hypothetical protein
MFCLEILENQRNCKIIFYNILFGVFPCPLLGSLNKLMNGFYIKPIKFID